MSKETFDNNSTSEGTKRGKDLEDEDIIVSLARRSRLARKLINTIIKPLFYGSLLTTWLGLEILKDPEGRRIILDREARTGLLEDSIIGDELYVPNENRTSLERKSTVAGRFVSYDFHRPEEFKSVAKNRDRQNDQGRLAVFLLDEIKYKNKNDYTPTGLLNIFDVLHVLSFDTLSLEQAIEQGFLTKTTYKEAYGKVGLYDRYRLYLELQQLSDKHIYAVTPKGNGVVILDKDGGEKEKTQERASELKRVFSPTPI